MIHCPVWEIGMSYGPTEVTRESCFPNGETLVTRMVDMSAMQD